MIDRPARNTLLGHIDAFLAGEIKSFEFDERIHKLYDARADPTVIATVRSLWFLYDDTVDHPVKFKKPEWDYVQRLRLLLMADAEISSSQHWTLAQPFALAGLLILAVVVFRFGWGWSLFLINFALGTLAAIYIYLPRRKARNDLRRAPFQSFASLRAVRRATPTFQKAPYPRTIDTRPLHSQLSSRLLIILWAPILPNLAPFLLLALLKRRRDPPTVQFATKPSPSPSPF